MRYWHHDESGCVFITDDIVTSIDPTCEEIDHETFLHLKQKYKEMPCRWCGDTGYFYAQSDLGYCNCEAGTLKVFEDHNEFF